MEEEEELSNRVGIIDHGELIAIGSQKELTQQVGQSETLILHINENDDPQALIPSFCGLRMYLEANGSVPEIFHQITPSAKDVLLR
ncbi:hypothetical protein [Candidatus Villigracilis saccharophilus]|uniref:hypothetical protein n=1 Tax=Candidatus Villigracilis saccharophilus TaxID=3140684 RepID=UPI003136C4B8|nr:hypothetical protein [Anaerolineales bacterium]